MGQSHPPCREIVVGIRRRGVETHPDLGADFDRHHGLIARAWNDPSAFARDQKILSDQANSPRFELDSGKRRELVEDVSVLESNPFGLEPHATGQRECEVLDLEVRLRILTGLPSHRGSSQDPIKIKFRDECSSRRRQRQVRSNRDVHIIDPEFDGASLLVELTFRDRHGPSRLDRREGECHSGILTFGWVEGGMKRRDLTGLELSIAFDTTLEIELRDLDGSESESANGPSRILRIVVVGRVVLRRGQRHDVQGHRIIKSFGDPNPDQIDLDGLEFDGAHQERSQPDRGREFANLDHLAGGSSPTRRIDSNFFDFHVIQTGDVDARDEDLATSSLVQLSLEHGGEDLVPNDRQKADRQQEPHAEPSKETASSGWFGVRGRVRRRRH